MKITSDVMVTVRDDVKIAIRIYQPDDDGTYPTLFASSPYRYDTDDIPVNSIFPWRETGPVEWYINHGYAYVHADARGTGKSEGVYGLLDKAEQQDLYDVIEWIAEQSWSNGKVGGIGQSYYAMSQWFMAIENPPHLACIAPYDGLIDPYRDSVYIGGVYGEFFANWYNMVRANNLHRAAGDESGREIAPDLANEIMRHQTFDDWWQERTAHLRLPEIDVPVLSVGAWGKVGLHLRGNILAYEELTAPKRLVVTGAANVSEAVHLFDQPEFHDQFFLPFYDHHLKGIDNGVMDQPPVDIFVRGTNAYRPENEWPLERAEYVPYYLSGDESGSVTSLNDGSLSKDAPSEKNSETHYDYPNHDWALGVVKMGKFGPDPVGGVLTFATPPLETDTEITGPILLELYASSDQPDTDFIIKLSDQSPQANEERAKGKQPAFSTITKGWRKASHRDKNPGRSSEYRPYYKHEKPEALVPGEVYKYEIEIHPTSHVFKAGHRIRLEIANGDSPLTDAPFTHQYLPHKVGRDTIHHGADYPSRLLLPFIE
jgi:putative CocE/NonD family hydrolase